MNIIPRLPFGSGSSRVAEKLGFLSKAGSVESIYNYFVPCRKGERERDCTNLLCLAAKLKCKCGLCLLRLKQSSHTHFPHGARQADVPLCMSENYMHG